MIMYALGVPQRDLAVQVQARPASGLYWSVITPADAPK